MGGKLLAHPIFGTLTYESNYNSYGCQAFPFNLPLTTEYYFKYLLYTFCVDRIQLSKLGGMDGGK